MKTKNLQSEFSTRQYMLAGNFEIYYYNDRYLPKVKKHVHDYHEFYFFLEGEVSLVIEERRYFLKPGDVILIPSQVSHYAVIHNQEQPYRRFVFWISELYWNWLVKNSPDYMYFMQYVQTTERHIFHNDVIAFNNIQAKVFRLIEEVNSQRFGKDTQISICVNDLILHLNRMVYEQNNPKSMLKEQSLYQNLIQFIEEHLDEKLSLERLAGEFFVSKYHIAHVFKEKVGLSIHQYITKKRLAACQNAILDNVSISEVYLMFGFKDYSGFYRSFKKEYGISPKEFKSKHIKEKYL